MPKHIEVAKKFGLIHEEWNLEDYCRHAVETMGYETICIHGRQGSGKSNMALQIAFWLLRNYDAVLDSIVFTPATFVDRLQSIGKAHRSPLLIFDDVGVSYPSTTFRTDVQTYQDVDACWAAIRTRVSIVILTIPLIDRLSKNIRDNVSFEIFMGRNRRYVVERIVRLPNIRDKMETRLFKVLVEEGTLDIHKVPTDPTWRTYWGRRLELADRTIDKMQRNTELDDPEGFTSIIDLAEELHLSPNTISQMVSRGVVRGQKINGLLYIADEWIPQLKSIYNDRKTKRMVA